MEAKIISKPFIVCPHCGKEEFAIGHLPKGQSFGPWGCDSCGKYFAGVRTESGADIELRTDYKLPKLVTLRFRHDSRLTLQVEAFEYFHAKEEETAAERLEHDRYYYEEHTCPTNYFHSVKEILFNGKEDPHGIFEFVESSIPALEKNNGVVN